MNKKFGKSVLLFLSGMILFPIGMSLLLLAMMWPMLFFDSVKLQILWATSLFGGIMTFVAYSNYMD